MNDLQVRQFGSAQVRFGAVRGQDGERLAWPWMAGDMITMPWALNELEQLHVLQRGTQFVLRAPEREDVFFGGTDERPFLVQLRTEHAECLRDEGQAAFYESLKPPVVAALEHAYDRVKTRRQGDVYAFPLPCGWDDVRFAGLRPRRAEGMPVGRTRHRLSGLVVPRLKQAFRLSLTDPCLDLRGMLAEGLLTAPDHAAVQLVGVHLLAVSPSAVPRRLIGTPYSRHWLGD